MQRFRSAFLLIMIGASLFLCEAAAAQVGEERKVTKDYTAAGEIVSLAKTTPLDQALSVLSELSKKFAGKVIIDPERRTQQIGVEIQALPWRTALETVLRSNLMWYDEYKDYMRVYALTKEQKAEAGLAPQGGGGEGEVELPNFNSREVRISAVFLEADLGKLNEAGIDWNFYRKGFENDKVDVGVSFGGAKSVSSDIFTTALNTTTNVAFGSIDAIIKFFQSNNAGEILASPEISVRSGETGRIQVGQDFSTKTRDFAGNVMDRFYSTGTIIEVKPYVLQKDTTDFIYMRVTVERSSVQPDPLTIIINKNQAVTSALLLDGEEIAIGGLIIRQEVNSRTGVPILKDLPWWVFGLRYIFGYDRVSVTRKELVLLLKANIVPSLAERLEQKRSGVRENVLQKERQGHEKNLEQWRGER